MFSACLRLSTSISKLPFLVFFTVFELALVAITFSMRKGKNLAWQTSSKDLITVNLGKFLRVWFSFFESDSHSPSLILRGFVEIFYLKTPFFAGPALHHPPRSPTWLRQGYATSILELKVGFRAVANFKFSALVKFLFSQRNWPWATAF